MIVLQGLPGLAAERPRAERRETDGDARLRDEREAGNHAPSAAFDHRQPEPGPRIFTENADKEIAHADDDQRYTEVPRRTWEKRVSSRKDMPERTKKSRRIGGLK